MGTLLTSFWTTYRCDWMEGLSHPPFARWCDQYGIYIIQKRKKKKQTIKSPASEFYSINPCLAIKVKMTSYMVLCSVAQNLGSGWRQQGEGLLGDIHWIGGNVSILQRRQSSYLTTSSCFFSHACFLKCEWMLELLHDPSLTFATA